jgi:hypothetical protein
VKPKKYIYLEAKMQAEGETNVSLSSFLKVNESTLLKKRTGESEFNAEEIIRLSKKLKFTPSEVVETFFPELLL